MNIVDLVKKLDIIKSKIDSLELQLNSLYKEVRELSLQDVYKESSPVIILEDDDLPLQISSETSYYDYLK